MTYETMERKAEKDQLTDRIGDLETSVTSNMLHCDRKLAE